MTKATDTHYLILIAYSRQKWSGESASMLCLYVHCVSSFKVQWLVTYRFFVRYRGVYWWTWCLRLLNMNHKQKQEEETSEGKVWREGEEAKRELSRKKEKRIKITRENIGHVKCENQKEQFCRCVLTFRRNPLPPSLFYPEEGVSSFLWNSDISQTMWRHISVW
jgi:hypothetical protein